MISRSAKYMVFVGSFFIQASWCFKSMQGLGFVAALSPALTNIYPDRAKRVEALKRHSVYYNAHPYMASPILGAVVNLEEKVSRGEASPGVAVSLKEALMGPYGSIGDGFFWGAIRPVAALAAILTTFFYGLWGPVLLLVLYNLFHILMRFKGLDLGLKHGVGVIEKVAALNLPIWSIRFRLAGSALLGVITSLLVLSTLGLFPSLGMGSADKAAFSFELSLIELFTVQCAVIALVLIINIFFIEKLVLQKIVYAVIVPALIFGIIIF